MLSVFQRATTPSGAPVGPFGPFSARLADAIQPGAISLFYALCGHALAGSIVGTAQPDLQADSSGVRSSWREGGVIGTRVQVGVIDAQKFGSATVFHFGATAGFTGADEVSDAAEAIGPTDASEACPDSATGAIDAGGAARAS